MRTQQMLLNANTVFLWHDRTTHHVMRAPLGAPESHSMLCRRAQHECERRAVTLHLGRSKGTLGPPPRIRYEEPGMAR